VSAPAKYPRIPQILGSRGTPDDKVLSAAAAADLLAREVVVEEKLDGANVAIWVEEGRVECSLRSGPTGQDRSRQVGPLRKWIGEHLAVLHALLDGERAVYGEWLLLTHTVPYDQLPAYLVGIDIRFADGQFARVDTRDELLRDAGLPGPPHVFRGAIGSVAALETLVGRSKVGSQEMEGLIVRTVDGSEPRVSKLIARKFSRLDDDVWRRGRPRNRLSGLEPSWL